VDDDGAVGFDRSDVGGESSEVGDCEGRFIYNTITGITGCLGVLFSHF